MTERVIACWKELLSGYSKGILFTVGRQGNNQKAGSA